MTGHPLKRFLETWHADGVAESDDTARKGAHETRFHRRTSSLQSLGATQRCTGPRTNDEMPTMTGFAPLPYTAD